MMVRNFKRNFEKKPETRTPDLAETHFTCLSILEDKSSQLSTFVLRQRVPMEDWRNPLRVSASTV